VNPASRGTRWKARKMEEFPLATEVSLPSSCQVERLSTSLKADLSRVLLRPYDTSGPEQARAVISRVMALPEIELSGLVDSVMADYEHRHRDVRLETSCCRGFPTSVPF